MREKDLKKLLSNVWTNTIHLKNGEWHLPASSTNQGRMNKTRSCVAGPVGNNMKEWHPAKCYLTTQDLEDVCNAYDRKCAWLGIPLHFGVLHNTHPDWLPKHPLAPSVDRIHDGDYTKDNIVICSRFANLGRNIYPVDRMPELVNLIAENIVPTNNVFERKLVSDRGDLQEFLI